MSLDEGERRDNILVLEAEGSARKRIAASIERQLPNAAIVAVNSLDQYETEIAQRDFDVVVLDYGLSGKRGLELIHELKLMDHEPTVLVVSESPEPKVVSEVYNAGCHRYLIKDGPWMSELGPAVRHLLRIRRLEDENTRLLAKLTEANALLEDKNRRLDEFSATVAHDIRGPLGGICMKLEFVLDHYREQLGPKVSQLLERGLAAGTRLTQIVQAMYDFAKLGSRAAKMSHVGLTTLIHEVVADMDFDEHLEIRIGVAENLPAVWGNPELLRRAFINLIGNAVKYNDKPEVVINIGVRSIMNRTLAQFCEIFVQDNGPGIAPEDLKDVFSMFGRGSGTQDSKEGLGVGLSVVQRIVELHFGKVSVESVVGQGTTFVLTLPTEKIALGQ